MVGELLLDTVWFFESMKLAMEQGEHRPGGAYHTRWHFADWDSDGDTDILVQNFSRFLFYERLPGDMFRELPESQLQLGAEQPEHSRFEVADWDGDWQLQMMIAFHMCFHLWNLNAPNRSKK